MTVCNNFFSDSPKSTTLVCLPGWSFTTSIWNSLAKKLSPLFDIILLDLPDLKDQQLLTLDDIAEGLHEKIPQNSILMGWSLGGLIATYFCHQFPAHCQKLITLASTPKFLADMNWYGIEVKQAQHFKTLAHTNLTHLIKHFHWLIAKPDSQKKMMNELKNASLHLIKEREKLLSYLDLLFSVDIRDIEAQLQLPQLKIFGAKDAIVPVQMAWKIKEKIKEKNKQDRIEIIEEAGHAPFISHSDLSFQLIYDYIYDIKNKA